MMTEDEFNRWPKCAMPSCHLKCCLRLRSIYCWPHTPGTPQQALENLRETEFKTDTALETAQ